MDHFKPLTPVQPMSPEERQLHDAENDSTLDQAPTDADKQARLEYLKSIAPPPKPSHKKLWRVVGVVMLLALIAGGAYWYLSRPKPVPVATHKTTTQTIAPAKSSTANTTTAYVSNGADLSLGFDYPSSWTVTPATNTNKDDQTITLSSPLTTIPTADGKTVTGKSVLTIRPASAGLSELSTGKAIAAIDSLQIAYTKPTDKQYQYPYLNFISLTGSVTPVGAFDEIILSGTTKFTKGASVTQASLSLDPIVVVNFYNCTTTSCTGSGSPRVSITNDSWTNEDLFKQTQAVMASLQIN